MAASIARLRTKKKANKRKAALIKRQAGARTPAAELHHHARKAVKSRACKLNYSAGGKA